MNGKGNLEERKGLRRSIKHAHVFLNGTGPEAWEEIHLKPSTRQEQSQKTHDRRQLS